MVCEGLRERERAVQVKSKHDVRDGATLNSGNKKNWN